jgi:hypothetical protein
VKKSVIAALAALASPCLSLAAADFPTALISPDRQIVVKL